VICGWLRPEIQERPLATELARRSGFLLTPACRLLALERERQAGDDEGCEKDRQKPLSRASEGDGLALGRVEGLGSAGVSAIADLHAVTSRFDWYLDRGVHCERSGTLPINHDVVRSTTDFRTDRFMRQRESCRHLRALFCVGQSAGPLILFHCVTGPLWSRAPWGRSVRCLEAVRPFRLQQLMVAWLVTTGQAWSHGNLR
jgi:hypothetical protein